jgi:HAD superfamily hydrolase (TIGR01549 family)
VVRSGAERPPTGEPRLAPLVLFDMDDTLFDHTLTLRAALAQLRRRHAFLRRRSLSEMAEEYARLIEATHGEVALGHRSSDEARAHRFALLGEFCGRTIDPGHAAALASEYRTNYQRARRPVVGAPEFVAGLHGRTRVGVVTNNTRQEQRAKLAFLGLERSIDFLVTSEEVGAQKPDPSIFREALERAHVPAQEAVMIGDVWAVDILGARSAGLRAVWFNRFRRPRPDGESIAQFASFRSRAKLERILAAPPSARD